jgi:MFS family permease
MLFTEPVVAFFTLWISFAWGILFLFFSAVVTTYQASYKFTLFQTGLVMLAITVGAAVGTAINPAADWLYLKSARKNTEKRGKPIPEARLYTAIPGSLLFTLGLFMFGWTNQPSIHWIVPTIAIAIVGVGIYSIYMGVVNYLTDSYEKYAASALSAASLGRNTFGAFLPLAAYELFTRLGYGWAGSLLGFVGLALSVVPVVLVLYGERIRARSPFMKEASLSSNGENDVGERDKEDV